MGSRRTYFISLKKGRFEITNNWEYKYKALRAAMLGLSRIYRREKKELLKEIQRLKQKIYDLSKKEDPNGSKI